jgi:hypothetical protein
MTRRFQGTRERYGCRAFAVRADDLDDSQGAVWIAEELEESFDTLETQGDTATEIQLAADGFVGGVEGHSVHRDLLQVLIEARFQRLEKAGIPVQLLPLSRDDRGGRPLDELLVCELALGAPHLAFDA